MQVLRVVAAVIRREGRILITRRPPGKTLGGLWEFPGGKIEPGESATAALVRELREELQVTIASGREIMTVEHPSGDRLVCLQFFEATLVEGEPVPDPASVAGLCWVEPHELGKYEFPPADAELLEVLMKG